MINEFEDDYIKKCLLSNQWTYGQLFPELVSPGPMPKSLKHKTHTFSSRFNDTVSVWGASSLDPESNTFLNIPERKGKMWVYFSPINDLLNLSLSTPIGVKQEDMLKKAVFYASSNGPMPSNTFTKLNHREIIMNGTAKRNLSITGYKKLRVTSAALVIKQIGPLKERSGILKVGMNYKGAIENVPDIVYDKFENYFSLSKIFHLNDTNEVICRFRLPPQLMEVYAPFEPIQSVPYFFIYGEGISTKISFEVDVVRHFEGMILPEYSSFHASNDQPLQSALSIQNETIRYAEGPANVIHGVNRSTTPDISYQAVLQQSINNFTDPVKKPLLLRMYNHAASRISVLNAYVAKRIKERGQQFAIQIGQTAVVKFLQAVLPHKTKVKIGQLTAFVEKHYNPSQTNEENAFRLLNMLIDNMADVAFELGRDNLSKLFSAFLK